MAVPTIASLSTGLPRISGGKSQSCDTPTSASASPSAQTISVALGSSETMRMLPPGGDHLGLHLRPRSPRFFDRTFVLDRRDVARIPVQDHGLEDPAHDLAAAGLGEHADEMQVADHRHGAELAPDHVHQPAFERVGRLVADLE